MNNHIQTAISEQGIEAYLHAQQHKSLLRFSPAAAWMTARAPSSAACCTTPSRSMKISSKPGVRQPEGRHHRRKLDLALLVDGLQAEREQGITIDVAYRYFSTAKRKFIISDTRAMSSTPATWPPAPPPAIWPSS